MDSLSIEQMVKQTRMDQVRISAGISLHLYGMVFLAEKLEEERMRVEVPVTLNLLA